MKGLEWTPERTYPRDQRSPRDRRTRGVHALDCERADDRHGEAAGFAPSFGRSRSERRRQEAPDVRLGKARHTSCQGRGPGRQACRWRCLRVDTWRGHSLLRIGAQSEAAGRSTGTLKPMRQDASPGRVPRAMPYFSIYSKMVICGRDPIPDRLGSRAGRDAGPELVISGSVAGAVTGKPVPRLPRDPRLRPTPRKAGLWWQEETSRGGAWGGGIHRWSLLDEVRYAEEGVVRACRGPGYEPAETPRLPLGRRRDHPGLPVEARRGDLRSRAPSRRQTRRGGPGCSRHAGESRVRAWRRCPAQTRMPRVTTGPDGRLTLPRGRIRLARRRGRCGVRRRDI